ncbi:hypothetical protein CcaverHIS002_0409290 [Cutaneotrichosporon cavernicola]|uniref:N-acetyltransferase domain-containing protein n=1 Tax=Cutaneotrichosporon cavernicola TaxID=279322 RepID=A0AA48QWF3_9TREE|nr:uncharacterized protein CcaverHIS019_0409220 [Cutaneotrichosporon cavernicola]BEI84325.1 hypothetical protein CcaverHIS002_0409290 [Cutaneotrichosporon cavernicola]BEI92102.1 hypothetical protein CcaverHIS019_0409220 [Cutaneotrichosporon cavernicola]BEI99872.1 hypothetical protein CcaverHIS631_0409150 [Cutaneotrichosporon cavernicola]BEJ07647.1 hypothetical protein CcaverHIS641_0409160 [Cutaneotrichosporon cavernicola]
MRILERIDNDRRTVLHARLRASNTAASPALARLRDSTDDEEVPIHIWALDGDAEDTLGDLKLGLIRHHSKGPSKSAPPPPTCSTVPSVPSEAGASIPAHPTPGSAAAADSDDLLGGLVGHTWAHWLHITYLFVAPAERGAGIGRVLLEQAERIARARGCLAAIVQTWDFQAPQFYIANGYEVAGKVEGYPPGITDYTLIKRFGDFDNSVGVRSKGVSLGVTDV